MNRLFILVAAGLVGTGCVSGHDTCDVRTLEVDWHDNFVRADDPQHVYPCATASARPGNPAVDDVVVYVNGQQYGPPVRCETGYVDIFDAAPGDYDIMVVGLDASNHIVSRDWFTVTAPDSCGDLAVQAQPAEGWLQLSYAFSDGRNPPSSACVANSDLFFSITDTLVQGGQPAYPDNSSVDCSYGKIPLAYGSYRLDWLEEDTSTLQSSACRLGTTFDIGAATTTSVGPVLMTIGGPACP